MNTSPMATPETVELARIQRLEKSHEALVEACKIGLGYARSIDMTAFGETKPILLDRIKIEEAIKQAEEV